MNPRNRALLEQRVRDLEAQVRHLEDLQHGNFFNLKSTFIEHATGFKDGADALREGEQSGSFVALRNIGRNEVAVEDELLVEEAKVLRDAFPGLEADINQALEELLQRPTHQPRQGHSKIVDDQHLFLVPFLYLVGGFYDWTAPILPGVRVSASHFSRLINIATPIVSSKWAPRYFRQRSLRWLCQFCAPPEGYNIACDILLFFDGKKLEIQRSHGLEEQRMTYSSVTSSNIVQFIGVTNRLGWFVDASDILGGRGVESDMAMGMEFWDCINDDAKKESAIVKIHLIVDRGFRDVRSAVQNNSWRYSNIRFTCELPFHLGTDADPQRKQHAGFEVEINRHVQAQRWVNEKAFSYLQKIHFFDRPIPLSTLHNIDCFIAISLAVANKAMGVPLHVEEEQN